MEEIYNIKRNISLKKLSPLSSEIKINQINPENKEKKMF